MKEPKDFIDSDKQENLSDSKADGAFTLILDHAGNVLSDSRKVDSQVDNVLIRLKQKQIDEQIRSNKVIEGILKDIWLCSDRVATNLESVNIREEIKFSEQDQERDIMTNGSGVKTGQGENQGERIETPGPYGPGEVAEEQQAGKRKDSTEILADITEILADIFDTLKSDNEQVCKIAARAREIRLSLDEMVKLLDGINKRLIDAAESVKAIAKKPAEQKAEPEPEQEQRMIHLQTPDGFAVCGALGTPTQPFNAGSNHDVTETQDIVNCPLCLKIMAESKKS